MGIRAIRGDTEDCTVYNSNKFMALSPKTLKGIRGRNNCKRVLGPIAL